MKAFLLDTHVWIWYINGSEELSKSSKKTINQALHDRTVWLAAISLWEMSMLVKRKRIILEMPCLEWINQSIATTHMQIKQLTPEIAAESCNLPGSFHGDPADCLITATARVEGLTLFTRDTKLIEYSKQKYLSVIKV